MHHQVLFPLETFPTSLAGECLHPLTTVGRLHVPHHVPLGREQSATLAARETTTAAAAAAAAAAAVVFAAAAAWRHGRCGSQYLIQPATCLPSYPGRVISCRGCRGTHRHVCQRRVEAHPQQNAPDNFSSPEKKSRVGGVLAGSHKGARE